MLPLPGFELHAPASIESAVELFARHGEHAAIIAGGTDLVPGMKLGLRSPKHLVSLSKVPGLDVIERTDDAIIIGAMTKLEAIARDPLVREHATALAEAAASVGGPHHRSMGTLGGNVCLDTRCRYYNQSHFWREALGFCIKKDGDVCHVVDGGRRCVATASNDTAGALVALGARISLVGPAAPRALSQGRGGALPHGRAPCGRARAARAR
jgi:4-hydroxybenzoyl-CoA reductase subunit beta